MGLALYRGTIRVVGRLAKCDVLAWKENAIARGQLPEFRVILAPLDLPDGEYTVDFDGRNGTARKLDGRWQVGSCELDGLAASGAQGDGMRSAA